MSDCAAPAAEEPLPAVAASSEEQPDEGDTLAGVAAEMQKIDWETVSVEEIRTHPLTLRDGKAWAEHGYSIVGIENGPLKEARITLNCAAQHEKSVGVRSVGPP